MTNEHYSLAKSTPSYRPQAFKTDYLVIHNRKVSPGSVKDDQISYLYG